MLVPSGCGATDKEVTFLSFRHAERQFGPEKICWAELLECHIHVDSARINAHAGGITCLSIEHYELCRELLFGACNFLIAEKRIHAAAFLPCVPPW
jgi:hypothetical protein